APLRLALPRCLLRLALGLADRPPVLGRVARELAACVLSAGLEDRAAVALAELAVGEQPDRLVGKVEEPDQVRDRRPGAPDPPRALLLAQPEIVDERRTGTRLVDGVQVLARHVLDQRRLQALGLALVADERGEPVDAGLPRGAPPPLACDQLVA